jgi:hypothetical protein
MINQTQAMAMATLNREMQAAAEFARCAEEREFKAAVVQRAVERDDELDLRRMRGEVAERAISEVFAEQLKPYSRHVIVDPEAPDNGVQLVVETGWNADTCEDDDDRRKNFLDNKEKGNAGYIEPDYSLDGQRASFHWQWQRENPEAVAKQNERLRRQVLRDELGI